jgi:hypothetical protein
MPITADQRQVEDLYDSRLQNLLATGLLAGAGGMGLFHALRKAKKKADKLKPAEPDYAALASAPFLPGMQPKIATQKTAFDWDAAAAVGMPIAGAGAGALYNAFNAKKGKRLRAALEGAGIGGGIGALGTLLGTQHGARMIGAPLRALENIPTMSGGGDPLPQGRGAVPEGISLAARVLAPTAGVAAGGYAVNRLLDDDDNKERENVDKIEKARQEYFNSLLADSKSAAVLEKAFDAYKSRDSKTAGWFDGKSAPTIDPNASKIPLIGPVIDSVGDLGSAGVAAVLLSSLGAAGVGGTYMYNKTKSKSDAKQLERARLAKERMSSLPGPWIDPREVAHVKALASGNRPSNNDV